MHASMQSFQKKGYQYHSLTCYTGALRNGVRLVSNPSHVALLMTAHQCSHLGRLQHTVFGQGVYDNRIRMDGNQAERSDWFTYACSTTSAPPTQGRWHGVHAKYVTNLQLQPPQALPSLPAAQ